MGPNALFFALTVLFAAAAQWITIKTPDLPLLPDAADS